MAIGHPTDQEKTECCKGGTMCCARITYGLTKAVLENPDNTIPNRDAKLQELEALGLSLDCIRTSIS